jgi:hypothetical protein
VSVTTTGPATAAAAQPKLYALAALLGDWEQDAQAAHEAYTTGRKRGPVTSLPARGPGAARAAPASTARPARRRRERPAPGWAGAGRPSSSTPALVAVAHPGAIGSAGTGGADRLIGAAAIADGMSTVVDTSPAESLPRERFCQRTNARYARSPPCHPRSRRPPGGRRWRRRRRRRGAGRESCPVVSSGTIPATRRAEPSANG